MAWRHAASSKATSGIVTAYSAEVASPTKAETPAYAAIPDKCNALSRMMALEAIGGMGMRTLQLLEILDSGKLAGSVSWCMRCDIWPVTLSARPAAVALAGTPHRRLPD